MAYDVVMIDKERSDVLLKKCSSLNYYNLKADINGICIELFCENKDYIDMWSDNFYHMSDSVRSHARIFCMEDTSEELHAEYDISTFTMFLFNFDYYGWIKSVALGLAGNILEQAHHIYSVHGAAIDIDGCGVTLIAPSKTGKTTQSWGLLAMDNAHLISDDWYFVQFGNGRPRISGSEKNCYIDADIGDVWEEYKPLVTGVKFDNKGRGIGNVRWVRGEGAVIPKTAMHTIILLKRDKDDPELVRKLEADEALVYLESHDFCNPHQLIRDERSIALRRNFFKRYLSECRVFMVNTTSPAKETQERIRSLVMDS
ncbi:MAG: hypothetical protein J5813_02825 [Candidatus Methanomethylophilaceae archaeon]|nr:hypothetical protein [Candidatus Methanomethylophilaceae archaeon]